MGDQGQTRRAHFEQQSSDVACRIVDDTHKASTGSCQRHTLITEEDYYNFA